jgi:AraC-like DNA-binding protein
MAFAHVRRWPFLVSTLSDALDGSDPAVFDFFDNLFTVPAPVRSAGELAERFGLAETTLASRFERAGLPSPRQYVLEAHLVSAAYLLGYTSISVAAASRALLCASPQAFSRRITRSTGMTATEFRRVGGRERLNYFVTTMIRPHRGRLRASLFVRPDRRAARVLGTAGALP